MSGEFVASYQFLGWRSISFILLSFGWIPLSDKVLSSYLLSEFP